MVIMRMVSADVIVASNARLVPVPNVLLWTCSLAMGLNGGIYVQPLNSAIEMVRSLIPQQRPLLFEPESFSVSMPAGLCFV